MFLRGTRPNVVRKSWFVVTLAVAVFPRQRRREARRSRLRIPNSKRRHIEVQACSRPGGALRRGRGNTAGSPLPIYMRLLRGESCAFVRTRFTGRSASGDARKCLSTARVRRPWGKTKGRRPPVAPSSGKPASGRGLRPPPLGWLAYILSSTLSIAIARRGTAMAERATRGRSVGG